MPQIVADDFNRANGSLGANWTVIATGSDVGIDIVSNQAKASAASGESLAWFTGAGWTGGNDQYAEAKIAALQSGKDIAIACRVSGSAVANANAYLFVINDTDAAVSLGNSISCAFYKQVNGSFTQIGSSFSTVISANDLLRLEVQGTSLRAYKNGSQVGTTQTDSALSSGKPGLYIGSGTSSIWDDFAAGDFGGGTTLTPGVGSLTFAGAALSLALGVGLGVGTLGFTGRAPTVSISGATTISIPAGSLAYAGQYVATVFGGPSTGVLTFTGYAPTVLNDRTIPLGVGTLAYTGRTSALQYDIRRDLGAGSLTLSGLAPSLRYDLVIAIPAGTVAYTGAAPTLVLPGTISPAAGALTFAGQAPSIGLSVALPAGTVAFSGQALALARTITLGAGTWTVTGQAPTVLAGSPTIAIGAGALTFSGFAPEAIRPIALDLGAGSLSLTGRTPTLHTASAAGADSSEIDAALIATLRADPDLAALVPDGVWRDEAPPGSTRFVIVSLIDANDEGEFGRTAYDDRLYLVKAVVLASSRGDIKGAAARIHALLEDGTLSIPNYDFMVMYREAQIEETEVDDLDDTIRWLHRGGHYRVQATPILST